MWAITSVCNYIFYLIRQKYPDSEIRRSLKALGFDDKMASFVAYESLNVGKNVSSSAKWNVLIGLGVLVVGIVIPIVSYNAAYSNGGGSYIIT